MAANVLYDELKALIFDAAASHEKIGPLEESVKWGQASFTPKKKNVGSSVRLDLLGDQEVGMYFICTTHLVNKFQEIYPDKFDYRDGRALVFASAKTYDREALKHCIALALTYKLKS